MYKKKEEEKINNNSNFISTYLKAIEMIRKLNEKYKQEIQNKIITELMKID